jgi:hypothetical protein
LVGVRKNKKTGPFAGTGQSGRAAANYDLLAEVLTHQVPIFPPSFLVMTMVAERGRLPAP